jgi:hypothetical protein
MVAEQPGEHPAEDDTALLIAALNHVMARHEARIDRAFQVINYFVVAAAVLVTAYAGALDGKHYGIAFVVALTGMVLAVLAFSVARQQRRGAGEVEPAIGELEGRIASKLRVDSLRIYGPEAGGQRAGVETTVVFALVVLLSVGSAIYAALQ